METFEDNFGPPSPMGALPYLPNTGEYWQSPTSSFYINDPPVGVAGTAQTSGSEPQSIGIEALPVDPFSEYEVRLYIVAWGPTNLRNYYGTVYHIWAAMPNIAVSDEHINSIHATLTISEALFDDWLHFDGSIETWVGGKPDVDQSNELDWFEDVGYPQGNPPDVEFILLVTPGGISTSIRFVHQGKIIEPFLLGTIVAPTTSIGTNGMRFGFGLRALSQFSSAPSAITRWRILYTKLLDGGGGGPGGPDPPDPPDPDPQPHPFPVSTGIYAMRHNVRTFVETSQSLARIKAALSTTDSRFAALEGTPVLSIQEKVTPVGVDTLTLSDSEDLGAKKVVQIKNVPGLVVADIEPTSPAIGLGWLDTSTDGSPGSGTLGVVTIAINTTLTSSHEMVLCDCTAASLTVTLPLAVSHPGRRYFIKKIDTTANTVTVVGTDDDTIEFDTEAVLEDQGENVPFASNGVDGWGIL